MLTWRKPYDLMDDGRSGADEDVVIRKELLIHESIFNEFSTEVTRIDRSRSVADDEELVSNAAWIDRFSLSF